MNQFEIFLNRYANLIVVHGINVQPNQVVHLSCETIHEDLARLIARNAYKLGAKYVDVHFADPEFLKIRVQGSSIENLAYVPKYRITRWEETVKDKEANIKLIGSKDPDLLNSLPPEKINAVHLAQRKAASKFYEEGIGKSAIHWTLAAASTPGWGIKMFPDEMPQKAEQLLWEEIFRICRVDTEDYLERWENHNEILQTRAKKLTKASITSLHFQAPGTDLKVGLSRKALWRGGREKSQRGVEFEPNIPTEEVFTTPDFRMVSGTARATRPFLVNGVLIKDLSMEFFEGQLSHFSVSNGEETFREYIKSDEGSLRLGEVALVGIDSPVYRSGLVFNEILFDENAACHIAIGSAYKFCIDGGPQMSDEDALAIGCNKSAIHTDVMISSEETTVRAKTCLGEEIVLIEKGKWTSGW